MKIKFLFATMFLFVLTFANAQDDTKTPKPAEKTQKEKDLDKSLENIKKEIENIKKNVDSSKLREMAKKIEKSAEEISGEMEKIAEKIEDKADELEDKIDKSNDKDDKEDASEGDTYKKQKDDKEKSKDALKEMFKNKKPAVERRTKTFFEVTYGLNGWDTRSSLTAFQPKLNTWSWFYDAGLKWKTRIGGVKSPLSVTYGISYLHNSYRFENNAVLKYNASNVVIAEPLGAASEDPKLKVGYISIPLTLDVKIGKKGSLGAGAYAGYRVTTRQELNYKTGSEKVEETRRSAYGINDLTYGGIVKIGVKGLTLSGRLALSELFVTNPNLNTVHPYMLGVTFGF